MQVTVDNRHKLTVELRLAPDLSGIPLASQNVTDDLGDLADEVYIRGVLEEELPIEIEQLSVHFEPVWSHKPIVKEFEVRLKARANSRTWEYKQPCAAGRWVRTAQRRVLQLHEEGSLHADQLPYRMLVALPNGGGGLLQMPLLQPPRIIDGTLEQFGVRDLAEGELMSDRPILVNRRVVDDSIAACLSAGVIETGRALLGVLLRLPSPLPNTSTRIVTLLTSCVDDPRHIGRVNEWKISPDALAEAAKIADLRRLGETVLTVVHTHGWSSECGKCNENPSCPLAQCTDVSLRDYQVLETLFPSKSTLMPIVGRKLRATGRAPVFEVHAWRGGLIRPVRWQQYLD